MALDQLACAYRNGSDRMVIVRCEDGDGFYLERVVFPFELLSFECPARAELEVWTHGLGGPEMLERLAVAELEVETPARPPLLELIDTRDEGHAFGRLQAAAG